MMNILVYGIYLVVFCLPLYLIRFKILGIPTNVLEVMIGALFVIWLVRANLNADYKRILTRIKSYKQILIPIILILVGVSIATIFSWDLRISAGIWKSWFIVPWLFFVVLITIIKKPKQVRNIFWVFILSGFIIAIISLVYLIQGNLGPAGRLQGVYNSPNYLAMYLAPALILSVGLVFSNKKLFKKIFLVTCILLLVTCLFFTKSLGAWLGIVIAVCFGLILYLYKIKKPRLFWFIICLGIVFVLLLTCLKINVLAQGQISFNARFVIWQKAWQVFKAHPIIGIGPGTFQDYFPLYPKWGVPQPHSIYWAFLLQTGIIGFIGFIWLIILFFGKGIKLLNTEYCLLITVLMMLMIYILVHGLADTTYWKNDLAVMFWLFIGLNLFLLNKADH